MAAAIIMGNDRMALIRLMHLVSPSLPTGAFAYSQGLEWAIEAGWIQNGDDLREWLTGLLHQSMEYVDIPLLKRMVEACKLQDEKALADWCSLLLACRETHELRMEEIDRGRAMVRFVAGFTNAVFQQVGKKPSAEANWPVLLWLRFNGTFHCRKRRRAMSGHGWKTRCWRALKQFP